MSRVNLAIVGGAVISAVAIEYLRKRFKIQMLTLETFELNRKTVFRDNRVVWIHVETRVSKEDIEFLNDNSVLVTTSTGSTHIANEVIDCLGDRFVSLRTETEFLKSITSTAELALTLILMGLTNVECAIGSVRQGKWDRLANLRSQQVSSAQVGIIGYGRLGTILGGYLKSIVREIIVWDIDESARARAKENGYRVAKSLDHLLANSDAASIHINASRGDKHLITRHSLACARRGLVLVNTSRGLLVSEDCIIWGIENGALSSYLSDVLEFEDLGEPLIASRLWKAALSTNRVTLTPHIGGASKDAIEKCEMNLARRLEMMISETIV